MYTYCVTVVTFNVSSINAINVPWYQTEAQRVYDPILCTHHHHHRAAVRVMSMSRPLCISASGFSWWYHWTGDEGALTFCDKKTVEMAAVSVRVFPRLSLCPYRLFSWSNADVASWRDAAFSHVVCSLSRPRLRTGGWTARLHGISCL